MTDKPTLPPPSEPFPGSKTPGWNDPPQLSGSNNTGRTRLNLNKRVAFPLQGIGGAEVNTAKPTAVVPPNQASVPPNQTSQPIAVVHPMPPACLPTSTITAAPSLASASTTATTITLPVDSLESSMRTLREQIRLVPESSPNIRREEIERRLGLIEQLWQSNNMSAAVQEKIYRLAKAISEKNFNEAMELYTSLVTNHTNECTTTWAVALRHVVLSIQPLSRVDEITPTTTASTSESNCMYVTAMPRQTISSEALPTETTDHTTEYSAVQHI